MSHSSSEAERIALDAAIRMEGIPALLFWDLVTSVLSPEAEQRLGKPGAGSSEELGQPSATKTRRKKQKKFLFSQSASDQILQEPISDIRNLLNVDYVPPSFPCPKGLAKILILEDNDAVIKMTI